MKYRTREEMLAAAEAEVREAMRLHWDHGHGEITIQIGPKSIRVQEGKGHLFEAPDPQPAARR